MSVKTYMESASGSEPAYQSPAMTREKPLKATVMGDFEGISGLLYARV